MHFCPFDAAFCSRMGWHWSQMHLCPQGTMTVLIILEKHNLHKFSFGSSCLGMFPQNWPGFFMWTAEGWICCAYYWPPMRRGYGCEGIGGIE